MSADHSCLIFTQGFCCPQPGVALKIMRLFRCMEVEGESWLVADMRLQCYTGEWAGYVVRIVACEVAISKSEL